MSENESIRCRVAEIDKKNAYRGWIRLDLDIMNKYNIKTGDIVEIAGKKSTGAIVIPAPQEDRGSRIIRMDGLIRMNSGAGLGEVVNISNAPLKYNLP